MPVKIGVPAYRQPKTVTRGVGGLYPVHSAPSGIRPGNKVVDGHVVSTKTPEKPGGNVK